MVKNKEGLKYLVRRSLGAEITVQEAAKFIGYSYAGMRKIYQEQPEKLEALFLGYKQISERKQNQEAA